MRRPRATPRLAAAGFTLVETLVALAIALLVVGALLAAGVASFADGRHAEALGQIAEDGALALHLVRQQVAQAGIGQAHGVAGGGLLVHRFPAISGCDAAGFVDLRAGILATDNCRRRASDPAAPDALEVAFEGSVLAGPASNVVLGGPEGTQPLDCLGNSFAPTHDAATGGDFWLVDDKFYVADGSLHCHGPGNAAGAALVPNVETLQVDYGMRADTAGAAGAGPVAWYDAAPPAGSAAWDDVVSVRVCVQVRSAARVLDPAAAATLGGWIDCRGNRRAAADGYLRRAFSTTIALQERLP